MKRKIAIFINLFVFAASFGAWIYMFADKNGGALSTDGITSLKFFTVLSNLLNGLISLIYAVWMLKNKENTIVKKTVKLVGTAAVSLTFLTVCFFLGPVFGYGMMFSGANFWLHLICPVASILSFIIFERGTEIPFKNTFFSVIPTALYAVGYLSNVFINGVGDVNNWNERNDFYGFFLFGNGVAAVIAVSILLITWAFALLMCKLGKALQKKNK